MAHEWEKSTRVHKGATPMYDEWTCKRCGSYIMTRPGLSPEIDLTIIGEPVENMYDECDVKIVRSIQNE